MEPRYYIMIAVVSTVILVVACFIIVVWLQDKWKRVVFDTSERLKILDGINKKYSFYKVTNAVTHEVRCKSKREFDRCDYIKRTKIFLLNNQERVFEWMSQVQDNRRKYPEYVKEINACQTKITVENCKKLHISYNKYIAVERKLFLEAVQKPVMEMCLTVCVYYTSPQGRNSYSGKQIYNENQIRNLLEDVIKEQNAKTEYQRQVAKERAKMTDGLRYDILKRDHFRCQICGATEKDGIKLHVDHIVPVSKGGKTVPSNLRTLCSRCNLGKRDKLED